MKAKYNLYRNLHKQLFSVHLKGLVIAHERTLILSNCVFVMKERGRDLVRITHRKNVHAWIAAEGYEVVESIDISELVEVYYCPYSVDFFCYKEAFKEDSEYVEIRSATKVYCVDNKIYVMKE